MPETSDPRPYRVSTVGWLFARAAFRDGPDVVDPDTLDRIVERAIAAFETGNVHHTRALFYLATPAAKIAARALDALGMPPRPRRPYTGPPADPASPARPASPAGTVEAAAGLLDRLPDGGTGRPLPRPVQAQALAWEDAHPDRDGRMLGGYVPVPVVWPPGLCQHGETICPHCLLTWADHHTLALFDHGPDGAAAGCQCPTCHPDPDPPAPHTHPAQQPGQPGQPEAPRPNARLWLTAPAGPAGHPDDPDDPDNRGGGGGVLCHALIDALAGAMADGDLGTHFPEDDPDADNARSLDFVTHFTGYLRDHGYQLINVDAFIVLGPVKLRPHLDQMRRNLAEALSVDEARISVKARSNDHLGESGRGDAAEAWAHVLLLAPEA